MRRLLFLASFAALFCPQTSPAAAKTVWRAGNGFLVVREMNLARQNPELYAVYLEELKTDFRGDILLLPGGTRLRTREGVGAVNEGIRFLRRARPLPALTFSPGISMAAAEHVADQAGGAFGHAGSDGSNPYERMNHFGTWSGSWGENISYGKTTARDVIIALIIDDGLPARKHRRNIFNPAFRYAGAALGPHARYRTVCSIDFVARYVEHSPIALLLPSVALPSLAP